MRIIGGSRDSALLRLRPQSLATCSEKESTLLIWSQSLLIIAMLHVIINPDFCFSAKWHLVNRKLIIIQTNILL